MDEFKSSEEKSEENKESVGADSENKSKFISRSTKNKIAFGVCGGIGEFFRFDPTILRIIFVLSLLLGYWGFIIYLILAVVLPSGKKEVQIHPDFEQRISDLTKKNVAGTGLILLGTFLLLDHAGLEYFLNPLHLQQKVLINTALAVMFIFFLLFRSTGKAVTSQNQLSLNSKNKIFSGVCSGLAGYYSINVVLLRVVWFFLSVFSLGVMIIVYLIFSFYLQRDNVEERNLH